MNTVGFPKRDNFDMGPYFIILCCNHCSAVLALIARRRLRLWPIMGIPSEPGGSLFDDLLLVRRRKIGRTKKKMVNRILFMVIILCI